MNSTNDRSKIWRRNTKQRMINAMGYCCQCCGYNQCNESLTFHHIDPKLKDFDFGRALANHCKWSKIVNELRKCILVCRNCHGEIEAGLRNMPKNFAIFDEGLAQYQLIGKFDACPMCDKQKSIGRKFCSHLCAQKNSCKVDWDNIDLIDLLSKHKISELEERFNVTSTAIYKRRNKILGR
jgi:hypothetical protein